MTSNAPVETLALTPAIIILAGGQSRRMGRDKAQIERNGISWLEHTARTALSATSQVIIIGRDRPRDWALDEIPFLTDEFPGAGPLGGLFTALKAIQIQGRHNGRLLLLACDMPLLTAESLRWLFAAAQRPLHHGLAVLNNGRIEPLFSLYTTECLPLIESRLQQENSRQRSLMSLIEAGDFETVAAPPEISETLRNFNTTQELQILSNEGKAS